jgi:hypothetical protein
MAVPTWGTDALGTALRLLGYSGRTLTALNQRASHDKRPTTSATTTTTAAIKAEDTTIPITTRTPMPSVPYYARLVYNAALNTAWDHDQAYAIGALVIPSTGVAGYNYECMTAGTSKTDSEPVWPTTEGATVKEKSFAAKWVGDKVTTVGECVLPAYADWSAAATTALNSYVFPTVKNGLVYKATARATDYKTGATEPVWPTVEGETIVDNKVTWTATAPIVYECTARAGDFKTAVSPEPTWPTTLTNTVTDDQVTWTAKQVSWKCLSVGDETVKVTVGNGTGAGNLTATRHARGSATGTSQVVSGDTPRAFKSGSVIKATGRYYNLTAVDTFVSYSAADAAALGKAINLYFGLHKGVGKRVFEMAKAKDKNLTLTVKE